MGFSPPLNTGPSLPGLVSTEQMWSYDAVYEVYTRLPDMPVPRSRFAGAIGNGKIYVVR